MSVYVEAKEHFVINRPVEENNYYRLEMKNLIRDKLSMLGAVMLAGEGKIVELKVCADGSKYSFTGCSITEQYDRIVRAVNEAENLDVVVEYEFWEYTSSLPSGYLDCINLIAFFERVKREDMKGLFYSCWEVEDCGEHFGQIFAYGEKDGKYYHGQIEDKVVESFPEGNWYADTDICADGVTVTGEALERVKQLIREIEKFTCNPASDKEPYDMCHYGLSYIMNNAELRNEKDFLALHMLLKELHALAGDVVIPVGLYVDTTGDEVRQLCIEYDQDMNPTFRYEAVV